MLKFVAFIVSQVGSSVQSRSSVNTLELAVSGLLTLNLRLDVRVNTRQVILTHTLWLEQRVVCIDTAVSVAQGATPSNLCCYFTVLGQSD